MSLFRKQLEHMENDLSQMLLLLSLVLLKEQMVVKLFIP
jgi:hypothetical protein